MPAVNVARTSRFEVGADRAVSGREELLTTVLERSSFVAVLTDDNGAVEWASPAFLDLVGRVGDPVGRSLFALGDERTAKLAALLRALRDAPHRQATAEFDFGSPTEPRLVRVTAERLGCGGGVLWWQQPTLTPERVERLTHALVSIAREVEWVGFGRRRASVPATPIGLLEGSEQLTERERSVATMLANGDTVAAIAKRLYVSPSTVRNYLSSMYRKLAVRDLAGLRELLARGATPPPAPLRIVDDSRPL